MTKFTIVCACNSRETLWNNLLASDMVGTCQCIIQHGYTNISRAYNNALRAADGDVVLFVHQDVYLPPEFESMLQASIQTLSHKPWGVLGPAGQCEDGIVGWVRDRRHSWGRDYGLPSPTNTLDELLLVMRRDDPFRFDEKMPNHHLIGTDLCMQAQVAGRTNYAVRAYCHHNSQTGSVLDPRFWDAADYVMKKWKKHLPIYSTVATLTGIGEPRVERK